jgi:hypothetical protein
LKPHQEQAVFKFVEENKAPAQIARELGTTTNGVKNMLGQANVKHEIEKRREDYRIRMKLTREDVAGVFSDAIEMARVMAEPATMIQGAKEVGRMLGYYEPEVIKLQVSNDSATLQQQLRNLTEAELYQLLEKEVEGEVLGNNT